MLDGEQSVRAWEMSSVRTAGGKWDYQRKPWGKPPEKGRPVKGPKDRPGAESEKTVRKKGVGKGSD